MVKHFIWGQRLLLLFLSSASPNMREVGHYYRFWLISTTDQPGSGLFHHIWCLKTTNCDQIIQKKMDTWNAKYSQRNQFYFKINHESFTRCFGFVHVAGDKVTDSTNTQYIHMLHQPIKKRQHRLLLFTLLISRLAYL